jgi:hypothetical protein
MRFFAMRRLLRFDTRDISKTNLDKNDFQHLAATQAPKEQEMPETMNESKWNHKSTKKTSRAVKGQTEVIVRHSRAVDEMYPGARSQKKNIKAIFIQNRDGERFKYPFIHPAGAFAMAQHVDHGGVPHDPAGKAIIKMSEQIAQLQEFQRKVSRSTLHDDATGITERAIGRLNELKGRVEALGKRHHYESWMAEFGQQEAAGDDIMELDAVTMEQYKQAFTQTSFQEELSGYFPLLHKIMSETNTVDLEDYVGESEEDLEEKAPEGWEGTVKAMKKHKEIDNPWALAHWMKNKGMKSHKKADESFAEWAEAVEQGKITDDQIESLKQAIQDTQQLDLGPDGQTAFQFFSEFGLDSDDLEAKFKAAAELDPKTDPLEVFKLWAQEDYPELLVALGISGTGEEQPPEQAAAPEQQPQGVEQPAEENEEMKGREPVMSREGIVKEVAKIVKSFYNADNPNVGPFRGGEGIALDCKKQIEEKFGPKAGAFAEELAGKFMEKLTMEYNQKHGQVGDDGLARLKELVGNIKQKVESIGDVGGHPGANIMSAEGQGDLSKALATLGGWEQIDSDQPGVEKYDYDDMEGGYYASGTIEHNLKTGEITVDYADEYDEIKGTFNSIGDAMRALRGGNPGKHGGKAPNFDKLGGRTMAGPDDVYKTDRAGKKGTLTKSRMDTMKASSPYRKTGPQGVLPEASEMARILKLSGLAK